jgi:peptide/nickel transport system permease protein
MAFVRRMPWVRAVGSGSTSDDGLAVRRSRSLWRKLLRSRSFTICAAILMLVTLAVIAAPLLTPYDPINADLEAARSGPSWIHPLGTNTTGMDNWARLLYGGRVSVMVGICSVVLSMFLGIVIGGFSGFYGGWVDGIAQRIVEVFMSFPTVLLMLAMASVLGPSVLTSVIIIGIFSWPGVSRLVRGQFLSLRERDFIMAARSVGVSQSRIVFRHLLPNVLEHVAVSAIFGLQGAILAEAGLSFLGAGVQFPTPSWGNLVQAARDSAYLAALPLVWMPAAFLLAVVIVCVNFIGDALQHAIQSN